jgi:hypothetical protein
MIPSTTQVQSAAWTAANPKTQGEMRTKMPTMSATHLSHSANWTVAATAITKVTMPPTHAVLAAVSSPEKPRTQGEMNSNTAQTTLIQSCTSPEPQKFPFAMQTSSI